jgi:uncharacterized membrane protein YvbJ
MMQAGFKYCPACKQQNYVSAACCHWCDAMFSADQESQNPPLERTRPMRETKYCPDCAAQNDADAAGCHRCGARFTWRDDLYKPQRVTVVDFDMKFTSMIIFMVKWALAAIPAMIILFFAVVFLFTALASIGKAPYR